VVIGTHPIPLKYLKAHRNLPFWKEAKMDKLAGHLFKEDHAIMSSFD